MLSSYSDQIARGQTTTQALLTSPLAYSDYPQTRVEAAQSSLITTWPWAASTQHDSDGTVGFEVTENPTL